MKSVLPQQVPDWFSRIILFVLLAAGGWYLNSMNSTLVELQRSFHTFVTQTSERLARIETKVG